MLSRSHVRRRYHVGGRSSFDSQQLERSDMTWVCVALIWKPHSGRRSYHPLSGDVGQVLCFIIARSMARTDLAECIGRPSITTAGRILRLAATCEIVDTVVRIERAMLLNVSTSIVCTLRPLYSLRVLLQISKLRIESCPRGADTIQPARYTA